MRRMITTKQQEEFENKVDLPTTEKGLVKNTEEYSYLLPTKYTIEYNTVTGESELKTIIMPFTITDINVDDFIYSDFKSLPSQLIKFNTKCKTEITDDGLLIDLEEPIVLHFSDFKANNPYRIYYTIPDCPLDKTEEYGYWYNTGDRKSWASSGGGKIEINNNEFTLSTNENIYIGYLEREVPGVAGGNRCYINKGTYLLKNV